jgi:hypothetical protein
MIQMDGKKYYSEDEIQDLLTRLKKRSEWLWDARSRVNHYDGDNDNDAKSIGMDIAIEEIEDFLK